jgi:hypothetical protein
MWRVGGRAGGRGSPRVLKSPLRVGAGEFVSPLVAGAKRLTARAQARSRAAAGGGPRGGGHPRAVDRRDAATAGTLSARGGTRAIGVNRWWGQRQRIGRADLPTLRPGLKKWAEKRRAERGRGTARDCGQPDTAGGSGLVWPTDGAAGGRRYAAGASREQIVGVEVATRVLISGTAKKEGGGARAAASGR